METKDIIADLGGPVAVGRHLGISSQAVSLWDRIPLERVPALLDMAKDLGKPLTAQQMRPDYPWADVCGASCA